MHLTAVPRRPPKRRCSVVIRCRVRRTGITPRTAAKPCQRCTLLLRDRKSTRLNSSHLVISYAVFCLKKKNLPDNRRAGVVQGVDSGTRGSPEARSGLPMSYFAGLPDGFCSIARIYLGTPPSTLAFAL